MEPLETQNEEAISLLATANKSYKQKKRLKWFTIISVLVVLLVVIITISILMSLDIIPNIFRSDNKEIAGIYGKWSSYGGGPKNQQVVPKTTDVVINKENVRTTTLQCTFTEEAALSWFEYSGYITIDDENYGYVTTSGIVYKFDLDNCTKIWNVDVAVLLGYDIGTCLTMRHTGTLFKNSDGKTGILFGSPNIVRIGISNSEPCWAIALDTNDGSLIWKTNLGEGIESYACRVHGFMVDENDHYAYGGMAVEVPRNGIDFVAVTRGKMFKLDINDGKIIHKWYSIDNDMFGVDEYTVNISDPYQYRGASMWNMPAIIDNYLIFGTGNLVTYPKYIEDCVLGNYDAFPIVNANTIDPCGNNRSHSSQDETFWRCLEKGIYPSSFIILNKKTFNLEAAIPLIGVDVHEPGTCRGGHVPGCMLVQGPDSDLAAVAAYKNPNDNKLYAAAAQKSGMFWVFEIPSGKIVIGKKVGHWAWAGGSTWSIGVDEENMIGIVSITGGKSDQWYKTILADGTICCELTGTVHAIDLNNGDTIWQMINPWGTINDIQCNDIKYDNYNDYTIGIQCETNIKDPTETVINVEIPPINETERDDITSSELGKLVAPITIVNDMVFIPSYSGDIFIHNLFNGTYIHTIKCPNREPIKGGVTIIEDRVIFYCGGGTIVSMKLQLS